MKKILLLIIFPMLLFSGCRSSQPIIQQYYLLELPAHDERPWPERISVLPGTCLISSADLAAAYATHQIAVREDSHQIRYFGFNEWAIRPEQAFTQLLLDFYAEHPVFEEVKHGRVAQPTDYVLDTKVIAVELDAREENLKARLKLHFLLTDGEHGEVLHSQRSERTEALESKDLNSFARAVSQLFTEELHAFSVKLLENRQ